jgi:hypothetical protein
MRLSIVYSVHDPDYGADADGGNRLVDRMSTSLKVIAELSRLSRLDFEVVVVEWAPVPGKPPVRELVSLPEHQSGRLRFIEVPASVHERFENAAVMPFFEYIAKNVAIRRAKGDWVLAATPDVFFNRPLARFLATGGLDQGAFYRIDRHDVAARLCAQDGWRRLLGQSAHSVFRVHSARGTFAAGKGVRDPRRRDPPSPMFPLHTNASGDFLLMSRANWARLRGYTELTTHAQIDGIMLWTAITAGLRQVVLGRGMRLYHQEHDRSVHERLPLTDWVPWRERYHEALAAGRVMVSNGEDWGLAGEDFSEYVL